MKALLMAGALALSTGVASAQAPVCGNHEGIVQGIMMDGLRLHASPNVMLPSGEGPAEVYVSRDGRWVMLAVLPDGNACIVFVGNHWYFGVPT